MSQNKDSSSNDVSTRGKVDGLLNDLKSKNFRKRNDAIEELGKFKDTTAVNKLYEIAESSNWDYKHRIAAVNSLGRGRKKDKRFINSIKKIVDNLEENQELRRASLTHLARMKDPSLIELFKRALNDEYRFIRFWAVRGLIKLASFKSETALIQALGDEDEEIRKNVYMHLERSKPEIIPYFKTALKSPDANKFLRYGIMGLLGRIDHADTVPIMIDSLNDGNDRVVRIAIRGLGKSENIKAISPLLTLYNKENKYERFIQAALFNIAKADMNGASAMMVMELLQKDNEETFNIIIKTLGNLVPNSIIALGELKTDPKLPADVKKRIDNLMIELEK